MRIKHVLAVSTLLLSSTAAFAWWDSTGVVPVVVPTTMECPVEYYNGDINLTFLGSQAEVASYNTYHDYLDGQWGTGAMTYPEWLVQNPVKITVKCPNNPVM